MDDFEILEQIVHDVGIQLDTVAFRSPHIKGLCVNDSIALSNNLRTVAEKACILSEELGHYYTTAGDIVDQTDVKNRKQEHRARLWAYNERIGLMGIIRAFEHHCNSSYEVAEFLGVTEDFLNDALDTYRQKYGIYIKTDNYIVGFEPYLFVYRIYV